MDGKEYLQYIKGLKEMMDPKNPGYSIYNSWNMTVPFNRRIRPNIVVLGAGATMAAIPNGDKTGHKSSCMAGFLDVLGLTDYIRSLGLRVDSDNLETIYSELYDRQKENTKFSEALDEVNNAIYNFYSQFRIPDHATMYDHLILSLNHNDAIATFNWDPLIVQAYCRIEKLIGWERLPMLLFLHGNVAEIVKLEGTKIGLNPDCRSDLRETYRKSKLLFPVKNKRYDQDPAIKKSWESLDSFLNSASVLTFIGYSAPESDALAIELIKKAWERREPHMKQIYVVDIKPEEELYRAWSRFGSLDHFETFKSFYETPIAHFPRRVHNFYMDQFINCVFLDESHGINPSMSIEEAISLFAPFWRKKRL